MIAGMAHDVFVSYSQHDKPVADAVVARLEQDGVRCWIAPRDIVPGTSWGEAIVEAIDASRVMVLVLSDNSNRSRQVVREVERAVAGNAIILPFRIEKVDPTGAMAYFLGTEHWLDALTPPVERHIERLSATVATLLTGDHAAAGIPDPPPSMTADGRRRPRWVLPAAVGAAVVAAVVMLATVSIGGGDPASTTTAAPATAAASTTSPPIATTTSTTTTTTVPVGLGEVGRFKPLDLDPTDLTPPGLANGFDVDGSMLALANGIDGVTRVSIGDPGNLRPIDTFGIDDAQDVGYADGYLYAVAGEYQPELVVFPDDGSGGVVVEWEGDGIGSLGSVEVVDGFAYVAAHDFVGIVDATDPSEPRAVFEWKPPGSTGNPANALVTGGIGYFAAGWDGLYLFDLTDPAAPALLSHWPSPNWIIDLVVADGIAYVTLGETGMATLDVADPTNPRMLGLVELAGFASRIDVAGGHAFVGWLGDGGALGGVAVVDVRDPENPRFVDTYGRFQTITDLEIAAGHVFVTEESEGVISFEITGLGEGS